MCKSFSFYPAAQIFYYKIYKIYFLCDIYENVLYEHETFFSSTNIFLLSLKIYFDRVRFLRLYASNARRKLSCLILSLPLFFKHHILYCCRVRGLCGQQYYVVLLCKSLFALSRSKFSLKILSHMCMRCCCLQYNDLVSLSRSLAHHTHKSFGDEN